MPKNTSKQNKKGAQETWEPSTIYPNEVIAAYEVKGNAIGRIGWDRSKEYGDKNKVRTFPKSVDTSTDKNKVELHPVSIEVLNVPSSGWIAGSFESKDGNEDTDYDPKIPFDRTTTFTRKAREGEDGEEVVERLGEAMWILRKVFAALIQEKLEEIGEDDDEDILNGPDKNIDPFSTHRRYNKDKDDKQKMEKIDGEKKIKRETPIWKVGISYNKKTEELTTVVKDLGKAKRNNKGVIHKDFV